MLKIDKTTTNVCVCQIFVVLLHYKFSKKSQHGQIFTRLSSENMQNFFKDNRVLIVEERAFKDRVCQKLGFTERQWYNRVGEKTALGTAERIVMEQVLKDIRAEVAAGTLDLHAYNIA